jgi:hypothetical protein
MAALPVTSTFTLPRSRDSRRARITNPLSDPSLNPTTFFCKITNPEFLGREFQA